MILFSSAEAIGCTSAIIGAEASASGRPLLWKHRDTSTTDNKVEYVAAGEDGGYSYVALFNAKDRQLKEAWTGMNEVGFAVMNTASYNIKDDNVPAKNMDKEGLVMTIALKTCRTVDDFEELLRSLPRPMGVEANFGVIDALGNGAFFETNNHSYVKFDLKDAPGHVLIRTNYSHSGRPNQGYGYVREANAEVLLDEAIKEGNISAEMLTEKLSRSFYHDVRKKDALDSGERWAVDEDFIPRYKSTATIVIEGIRPLDNIESATPDIIIPQYIMWTGLGYPPVTDIYPVWCHKNGIEEGLRGIGPGGTSPIGNESKKRRAEVFPPRKGGNKKYIDLTALSNENGTGYLQILPPRNHATYEKISRKRDAGEFELFSSSPAGRAVNTIE
ncbi:MAG: C45 family peptidase [Muribaculaceae bacterium]|nr:C45 family peptidase [Muribaculaceae bacterium]